MEYCYFYSHVAQVLLSKNCMVWKQITFHFYNDSFVLLSLHMLANTTYSYLNFDNVPLICKSHIEYAAATDSVTDVTAVVTNNMDTTTESITNGVPVITNNMVTITESIINCMPMDTNNKDNATESTINGMPEDTNNKVHTATESITNATDSVIIYIKIP